MTWAPERPGGDAVPAALGGGRRRGVAGPHRRRLRDGAPVPSTPWPPKASVAGSRSRPTSSTVCRRCCRERPARWVPRSPRPARGEAVVELIADGVHLDGGTVRMVYDAVGPGPHRPRQRRHGGQRAARRRLLPRRPRRHRERAGGPADRQRQPRRRGEHAARPGALAGRRPGHPPRRRRARRGLDHPGPRAGPARRGLAVGRASAPTSSWSTTSSPCSACCAAAPGSDAERSTDDAAGARRLGWCGASRPRAARMISTNWPMMSLSPKSFGVKTAATPCSSSAGASASGMIPPTMTGTSPAPGSAQAVEDVGNQLQVRAGQDRQPDQVHVLGHRGRDDLLPASAGSPGRPPRSRRRGPGPRSARRRCCARRAPACRRAPAAVAQLLAGPARPRSRTAASSSLPRPGATDRARDAGRRAELAEHLAQRLGPLPRRHARPGRTPAWPASGWRRSRPSRPQRQRGPLPPVCAGLGSASRSARATARTAAAALASTSGSTVWIAASRSAVSGLGSVVSNRLTPDDDVLARTRSAPGAAACEADQRGLHVAGLDRRRPRRPAPGTRAISARAPATSSATLRLDDHRPGEQVVVLEQVRLVGQHLLDAAATTAGPTAAAARAPRSRPAAAPRGPGRPCDSVTPSISSTIRWTLFSGWASVRPRELTCTP